MSWTPFVIASTVDAVTTYHGFHTNVFKHIPAPVVGNTVSGRPIQQGFPGLEITWKVVTYDEMAEIYALWDGQGAGFVPKYKIMYRRQHDAEAYDEEHDGIYYVVKYGIMHQPKIGQRLNKYYQNVSVTFTNLMDS